jgi:hypothetical protein
MNNSEIYAHGEVKRSRSSRSSVKMQFYMLFLCTCKIHFVRGSRKQKNFVQGTFTAVVKKKDDKYHLRILGTHSRETYFL